MVCLPLLFLLCLMGVSFVGAASWMLPMVYGGLSLATFLLYARDKSAAIKGHWRTPENTLHVFSLLGGWPGAWLGQALLRHKSRKLSFRILFWVTVLGNASGLALYLSPELQSVLGRAISATGNGILRLG